MKSKERIFSILIVFFFCVVSWAQEELVSVDKDILFEKVISNSKALWIPEGKMEVVHEEYRAPKTTNEKEILSEISRRIKEYQEDENKPEKAEYLQKMALDAIPFNIRYRMSNEYRMKTTKVIKYDGKKFFYDITVDSREDSIQVPDELKGNSKTIDFNMNWNKRRIIYFDGVNYTMYAPSVNHALIQAAEDMPQASLSILGKGLIPWGYGSYTYDNLIEQTTTIAEKNVDGRDELHLDLIDKTGSESSFVLDAAKEYAPLSGVVNDEETTTVYLYSDYKIVDDSWGPGSISIEKFDKETNELLEGDYITIKNVSREVPSSDSFTAELAQNTLVEYSYDISRPQLLYYSSNYVNNDLLIAERMAFMNSEDRTIQNCATSSLQYAALQLGKDILGPELSTIVNLEDMSSSIEDMEKYAEKQGFYCKTVSTDIQTLKELYDCQAILHIPGKNHYVLLDHVDENYVWLIDLTEDKFYYRKNISFFEQDWAEGTALLISNKPIVLPSDTYEIPSDKLVDYQGGYGYSCTYELQEYYIYPCRISRDECYDLFEYIFPRKGCESAESGTCNDEYMLDKITWPCVTNSTTSKCELNTDAVEFYFMYACE